MQAMRAQIGRRLRCLRWLGIVLTLLLVQAGMAPGAAAEEAETPLPSGQVWLLRVNGAITPAVSDYLLRGLEQAAEHHAALAVIALDTPGGLDRSMRDIIQAILAAPMPVATYVAPPGARAASAGTYILYASHIAAMAPGTNLGAATPVQIGGPGSPQPQPQPEQPGPPKSKEGETDAESSPEKERPAMDNQSTLRRKQVNDAVAYIRSLAELRGRNVEWAEKAVLEAASLPAGEALALGVIDLVARDLNDLLRQVDGRRIELQSDSVTLATEGLTLHELKPDWRNQLLAVITDPNVAYILMLIGVYGLFFEFSNPGALVPGIAGAICLLLALYAFQVLPVNYTGLALIALGLGLIVAEAFAPSFGALGLGGVVAFIIGSVILMDESVPGFELSLTLIITFALLSAGIMFAVMGLAMRAHRNPVVSGAEEMVDTVGVAPDGFTGQGLVLIHGERWRARSATPVSAGQRVRVKSVDGLTLNVEAEDK